MTFDIKQLSLLVDWYLANDKSEQAITALLEQIHASKEADPKRANFNHYKDISFFKPNLREISDGMNLQIDKTDKETIKKAANKLKADQNLENLMVTLSDKGVYISGEDEDDFIPAHLRNISYTFLNIK